MEDDSRRPRWLGWAALVVAACIFMSLAVNGPIGERSMAAAPAAALVSRGIWGHVMRLVPLWLIAAMLFSERRRRGLTIACVVIVALDLVFTWVDLSRDPSMLVRPFPTWFVLNVYYPLILGLPELAPVAVLVLLPRLRGGWRILQWAMVVGMCVFAVLFLRAPKVVMTKGEGTWVVGGAALGVALLIGGLMMAWLTMFRQLRVGKTPSDCKGEVKLTCPRCATAQTIPLGQGECSECRLQVFISVDEGACRRCGYRRRGLVSERCPECGMEVEGASA